MFYILRSLVSLLLLVFALCSPNAAERPDMAWGYPGLSPENQNFMREILHNSRTIVDYTNQHVLNPQAPASPDFLNLNSAHQSGSKQAVSFLREMMGLPFETIPGFNDQPPFGGTEEGGHEKVTEVFGDSSSHSDDEFMNMLYEVDSGLSLKDPSPQAYLDNLYGLSGEAFVSETKEAITKALQQQGASTQEINTVLENHRIISLIHKSAEFNEQRRGLNVMVTLIGEEDSPSLAPNRVLTTGLKLCTEAAHGFSEFSEKHPTLASLSLTAMQVAPGGPASYVRNMAMHYTGAQDQVDGIVEVCKAWVSSHLQGQMGMNSDHANLLTQGGGFGLTIGVSTLGGASKEKVLHEAKNVADTAKKLLGAKSNIGAIQRTELLSKRQARREAMRQERIPTSQQPSKQINTQAGYQYEYEVPTSFAGTQKKVVTDQTTDRVLGHGPHWEAGNSKIPERKDVLGRVRVENNKTKLEYNDHWGGGNGNK